MPLSQLLGHHTLLPRVWAAECPACRRTAQRCWDLKQRYRSLRSIGLFVFLKYPSTSSLKICPSHNPPNSSGSGSIWKEISCLTASLWSLVRESVQINTGYTRKVNKHQEAKGTIIDKLYFCILTKQSAGKRLSFTVSSWPRSRDNARRPKGSHYPCNYFRRGGRKAG